MRLTRLRLTGFQSFADTGEVRFGSGINLVIGQNNVGKSALLRCLSLPFRDDRHRSEQRWQNGRLPTPILLAQIELNGEELVNGVILRNGAWLRVGQANSSHTAQIYDHLFGKSTKTFEISRSPGRTVLTEQGYGIDPPSPGNEPWFFRVDAVEGNLTYNSGTTQGRADELPDVIDLVWLRSMFYFSAERMNVGEYQHHYALRLEPDARNLPAVLDTLHGARGSLFRRLVEHLRTIFPLTVGYLSVQPLASQTNMNEIRVWPTEAQNHPELSFALKDSGTGVAQVIAILAAVMTVEDAIVVIDEVNSFLHPAAVKGLLRILQTHYAQHQYIISTHSPDVISFANASTIHLVKRDGYISTVLQIDMRDVHQIREVSDNLGVSMSDVFAAERIIWVEGQTEEICFPYIYGELIGGLPKGTLITSVVTIGDLGRKGRTRELIFDIYKRLSTAAQPLVKGVVFSFDTETLIPSQILSLQSDSGGLLHFLPRRNFECYLVDPAAIAEFINERDTHAREGGRNLVSSDQVVAKLTELSNDKYLIGEWDNSLGSENWLAKVDAANLIKTAVAQLSANRVPFVKGGDSLALLKSIMREDCEKLRTIANYIRMLVDAVNSV